jgi:uncharacterized protein (DUF302 family)
MMYAFGVELRMPFIDALEKVNQAISEEGLGIVSEIDVQAVMRKKLNEEIPPYRILGACAPKLAKRVMQADPDAGALLPCNIVVRQINPELTGVTFMDPDAIFALSEDAEVVAAGREAKAIVEAVRDRLTGQHPVDLTRH